MKYKIYFPTGYLIEDELNENIDFNVILENGKVYWGTLFTLANIEHLLNVGRERYFWAINMVIVKDLGISSIRNAVDDIVKDGYCDVVLSEIGTIQSIFKVAEFEEITRYY